MVRPETFGPYYVHLNRKDLMDESVHPSLLWLWKGRSEKLLGCYFHLNGRPSFTDALRDDKLNAYECHCRLS